MLSALNPTTPVQTRPFNFSPGPAALPELVLTQMASEMLNWHGSGVSVVEMGHRSKEFMSIYEQVISDLRHLLQVPPNFKILLMQGGGIGENAIVPMNISQGKAADFIVTGIWSQKSLNEAQKYCDAHIAADAQTQANGFYGIPALSEWKIRDEVQYVHICSNETVHGVEFHELPDLKALTGRDVPLVVDASSHILSRPINWSRVGVLFAGAQKNIGPAGLTIVFVREDLLGIALDICPSAFNYSVVAHANSMYNTPPTFAIYAAGLVLQWIKSQGGLNQMEQNAILRSELIYTCIDTSEGFYTNPVEKSARSRMNIPFFLNNEQLNTIFIKEGKANNLLNIQGHKMVGGMRASVYNAMPVQGAKTLAEFMKTFAKQHG